MSLASDLAAPRPAAGRSRGLFVLRSPDGSPPNHDTFLGTWRLIAESCEYEQGEPRRAGTYRIREAGPLLVFKIDWTAAEVAPHHVKFSGPPNGRRQPYDGRELADSLCVVAPSSRELNPHPGTHLHAHPDLDCSQPLQIASNIAAPPPTFPSVMRRFSTVLRQHHCASHGRPTAPCE